MIAALRQHVHGVRVVRLGRAFHDARDLLELAAHFDDHRARGAAHGFHRHGAEQVRHQAADEQADDHGRVGQREHLQLAGDLEVVRVVREQHQRGETGRADRVALGDGLGRVADGVERVGDLAHFLRQAGHLGDAAGVVGDRAVGVERHDHAGHRQHGGRGDGDAVQAGERVRAPDGGADREHRQAVDFIETARPAITLVPWPVCEAAAT